MKSFDGYKAEPLNARYPQLPAGPYICVIKDVREDGIFPDDSIILRLEVSEGEWAGYYSKRYASDTQAARSGGSDFGARYKGDFRIRAPRPENPHIQNLDWAIRSFNGAIWAIEDSNDGFHFDFDNIPALKGKTVGINVRNASYQGVAYTEIGRLESAKQIRDGKVRQMKDREDRFAAPTEPAPTFSVSDVDVPF